MMFKIEQRRLHHHRHTTRFPSTNHNTEPLPRDHLSTNEKIEREAWWPEIGGGQTGLLTPHVAVGELGTRSLEVACEGE